MKQVSRKRVKSFETKSVGVLNKITQEEAVSEQSSQSDFSEQQKIHHYRCECCRNKPKDDYLRQLRTARESQTRRKSELDIPKQQMEPIMKNQIDETFNDETPKQQNSRKSEANCSQFLIKTNEQIGMIEQMMKERGCTLTYSNNGPDDNSPDDQDRLSSPTSRGLKERKSAELSCIKQIDQSASFGQQSQIDPQHLTFSQTNQKQQSSSIQLRLLVKHRGSLYEKVWSDKHQAQQIVKRLRDLFTH